MLQVKSTEKKGKKRRERKGRARNQGKQHKPALAIVCFCLCGLGCVVWFGLFSFVVGKTCKGKKARANKTDRRTKKKSAHF